MSRILNREILEDNIRKVIDDYAAFIAGKITLEQAQTSIVHIFNHILYPYEYKGSSASDATNEEREGKGNRSLTLMPKATYLLDVMVIYRMESGIMKYRLTIRPWYSAEQSQKTIDVERNDCQDFSPVTWSPRSDSTIIYKTGLIKTEEKTKKISGKAAPKTLRTSPWPLSSIPTAVPKVSAVGAEGVGNPSGTAPSIPTAVPRESPTGAFGLETAAVGVVTTHSSSARSRKNISTDEKVEIKEKKEKQLEMTSFICMTRDSKCCFLNPNHQLPCRNCCLDQDHARPDDD